MREVPTESEISTGVGPVEVLIVLHALHSCGAARHCLDLLESFQERKVRTGVIALNGGGHWYDDFAARADVLVIGDAYRTTGEMKMLLSSRTLRAVTAHHLPAIKWALEAVDKSVQTFAHFHTEPLGTYEDILVADCVERGATLLFPTSHCLKQYRALCGARLDSFEANASVIPNPPPKIRLPQVAAGRRYRSEYVIGIVSRIDADKLRLDDLVTICESLCALSASVTVVVAGYGELLEDARTIIRERGLLVQCLGHVEDMAQFYQSVDVVVIPSYTEVLPYGALEAVANGVRTVVTCSDFLAEIDSEFGSMIYATSDGGGRSVADIVSQILTETQAAIPGSAVQRMRRSWNETVGRIYASVIAG